MLASSRLLRTGINLSNSNFSKDIQKCRFHVYAPRNFTVNKRRLIFLKKEAPVHLGIISSVRFASNVTDIPVPPVPPPPEVIPEEVLSETELESPSIRSESVTEAFEDPSQISKVLSETELESPTSDEIIPKLSEIPEVLTSSSSDIGEIITDSKPQIMSEVLQDDASTIEVLLENSPIIEVSQISSGETEVLHESPTILEAIPDPPPIVEEIIGEATLQSIGLGGWSPIGLAQRSLDFLHVTCDLPWWGAIVVGTIVVRVCMFPLVIIAQRNAAKMHNNLPGLQALQLKMTDARERGDKLESAKYGQEMVLYFKEKGINPLKNMLVPLAQAPVFISFFLGLRGMARHPVESMREGGMLWFVDLTVPDQFYLLPLITSATLYLTIELGTDAARVNSANLGMMKYVLRAMPIVIFPFTIGFPSGILVYWTSSNFISLLQVLFLKIPKIRKFFNIEQLKAFDKDKDLPIKDKGFVKGVSDSWTNLKITRELEERQRIDEINFMNAGRGAVKKTFKFDPTQKKPTDSITTIQAKKRH